jgi:hypothetical protein
MLRSPLFGAIKKYPVSIPPVQIVLKINYRRFTSSYGSLIEKSTASSNNYVEISIINVFCTVVISNDRKYMYTFYICTIACVMY